VAALFQRGYLSLHLTGRDLIVVTAVIALLTILIAAAPLATGTPASGNESGIPPVVWEVVGISGPSGARDELTDAIRYTVQFQPGGVLAVTSRCNQSTGTYSADDRAQQLRVSIATVSPCASASRFWQESFAGLLNAVNRFEFDRDGFLVLAGDDERLWLRAQLTGVVWEWRMFRGGDDSRIEPDRPSDFTLSFAADDRLTIEAGCIRTMGTYTADGTAIEFVVDQPTRVTHPCEALTGQYLRDLGEVTSYVFRDGNLYLALWADAGIMEFAARYEAPQPETPQAG
jgi:heat shock protein HslJ